jgi:hypothetical protein
MKAFLATLALGAMVVSAIPAQAAGCVSGAAVGGVAGHVAGHHGVLGAAAGCAVGHHQAKKNDAAAAQRTNTTAQPDQTTGTTR